MSHQQLSQRQNDFLSRFTHLSDDDIEWIAEQVEILKIMFDNPTWTITSAEKPHTQAQVGYLSGAMDLEREERLELLGFILDTDLYWDGEDFPGAVDVEHMTNPDAYPGPSGKDMRINRWMYSVLIDYWLNGEGIELNEKLGYASARATAKAQSAARKAAKAQTTPALFS